MSAEAILSAFPRRQLSLQNRIGNWLWRPVFFILFGLGMGGFGAGITWTYLPGILTEHALASNAAEATPTRVGGECRTQRLFITTCTLELSYNAADKRPYRASLPIFVFGSFDHSQRIAIRHDRASPRRVGTNWGQAALTNRWIAMTVSTLFMLGIGVASIFAAMKILRNTRRQARLAQAPQPGVVTVTGGAKQNRYTTNWSYVWFDGQRQLSATDGLSAKSEPFWLNPGNGHALALVGADGASVLLDRDLKRVSLTDGERQALQDAQQRMLAAA
jgi:hypothetical protein